MINRNKKPTSNDKFNIRKEKRKMKTRIFTIFIMVATLAMFAPVAEAGLNKVTGGGVIEFMYADGEANLAISARYDGVVSGNVLYNDHYNKFKLHATVFSIRKSGNIITIEGLSKDGEYIGIEITDVDYDKVIDEYDIFTIRYGNEVITGNLVRGNIKLHFDE